CSLAGTQRGTREGPQPARAVWARFLEGRVRVMKINRSMVAAVLMMVGSFSAMGCKKDATAQELPATPAQASATADQPVATPAPEPVKAASTTPVAANPSPATLMGPSSAGFIRPAPPPLRIEVPGRAPSGHHIFRR